MSFQLSSGYTTQNLTAPGKVYLPSDISQNSYIQANDGNPNGVGQTFNLAAYTGHAFLATDKGDTIKLSNQWHLDPTAWQNSNVGAGKVYDSDGGGKIMVSGGADVQIDPPAPPTVPDNTTPTKDQLISDINAIEKNDILTGGKPDGLITKQQILDVLKPTAGQDVIPAQDKNLWQQIADHFNNYDNSAGDGGKAKAGDGLINIDDLMANGLGNN